MSRGKIISTTARGAVSRARRVAALIFSRYKLGAGGQDPSNDLPWSELAGIVGSDCVGFVLWCLGLDRFQAKRFKTYGGWINTDSILIDATGPQQFFEITHNPRPGDAVVYPGITKNGKRTRIGHIALVVEVDADTSRWTDHLWERTKSDRGRFLEKIRVIDCAASAKRKLVGRAVQETTANRGGWNKPDARFIRYKLQAPDTVAAILVNGKILV